jgi:hypothetical protein
MGSASVWNRCKGEGPSYQNASCRAFSKGGVLVLKQEKREEAQFLSNPGPGVLEERV